MSGRDLTGPGNRLRRGRVSTIKDVARMAGVAPASVTRVLSGHPYVSDAMAKRVMSAVDALDYRPDQVAASLRRGRSQVIGFILSDIINPTLAELADGLETELRRHGYDLLLANSHGDPARDVEGVELLRQRRIDGLVVMCVDQRSSELRDALRRWGGPTVLVDREIAGLDDVSIVETDHRHGAARLVGHLLDLGHRRIGYLGGPVGATQRGVQRRAGMTDAYESRGLRHDDRLIKAARPSPEYGREATAEFLDSADPPTAIISGTHPMLVGSLLELHSRGVAVGRDLAVACLDDNPIAALHHPPITSLHRDTAQLMRTVADLLVADISGSMKRPRTVILPVDLIIHESTSEMVVDSRGSIQPDNLS